MSTASLKAANRRVLLLRGSLEDNRTRNPWSRSFGKKSAHVIHNKVWKEKCACDPQRGCRESKAVCEKQNARSRCAAMPERVHPRCGDHSFFVSQNSPCTVWFPIASPVARLIGGWPFPLPFPVSRKQQSLSQWPDNDIQMHTCAHTYTQTHTCIIVCERERQNAPLAPTTKASDTEAFVKQRSLQVTVEVFSLW